MIYKHVSMCMATVVLLLPVLAVADDSRRSQPELVWSEEFSTSGSPDATIWNHDIGATGWGNRELQRYTDDLSNARVENGNLVITARRSDGDAGPFTSARIHTMGKLEFQYGILVARIRIPDLADGLWPAFWALGARFSEIGWPDCGEIDIMEMGHSEAIRKGLTNRRVGSAAHWEHRDEHAVYDASLDSPVDLTDDFHIFRMTWTPEFIRTSVDGEPVWTMDIRKRSCTDCTEFHEPFFVILNLAVGGEYPGKLTADEISAPFPAEMVVDYIRLYDNGFTRLSGSAIDQSSSN